MSNYPILYDFSSSFSNPSPLWQLSDWSYESYQGFKQQRKSSVCIHGSWHMFMRSCLLLVEKVEDMKGCQTPDNHLNSFTTTAENSQHTYHDSTDITLWSECAHSFQWCLNASYIKVTRVCFICPAVELGLITKHRQSSTANTLACISRQH